MSALEIVRPHALAGLPPREIEQLTGINPNTIRYALAKLRREGAAVPVHRRGRMAKPAVEMTIGLSLCAFKGLRAEAARRGIDSEQLVARAIGLLVRDGLFAAVLDDAGEA